MNHEELQEKLVKWGKRLGLSDWNFEIQYRDNYDLNGVQARTNIQPNIQCAKIKILNSDDRQKSDMADGDIELDLVHELVHIRLWSIDPMDAEGVLYTCREQAVEWIAKALINSDRKK